MHFRIGEIAQPMHHYLANSRGPTVQPHVNCWKFAPDSPSNAMPWPSRHKRCLPGLLPRRRWRSALLPSRLWQPGGLAAGVFSSLLCDFFYHPVILFIDEFACSWEIDLVDEFFPLDLIAFDWQCFLSLFDLVLLKFPRYILHRCVLSNRFDLVRVNRKPTRILGAQNSRLARLWKTDRSSFPGNRIC